MSENEKEKNVVLLVDDEPDLLESCARILEDEPVECVTTTDSSAVLEIARRIRPSVVVTDFKMPGKTGMDILAEISSDFPFTPVVMISAYATVERVVEAVKLGAFDYLTKPFSPDQLLVTVRRALEQNRLQTENAALKSKLKDDFFEHSFVGKHPKVLGIVDMIKKVAGAESNVLLHGETGTGKKLVALAIHMHSGRFEKPFIVVDCTTMTKEMLEASPDGADEAAAPKGVFEAAEGGTLYLDKVEELDLGLQARLLRVLQDKMAPKSGGWDLAPVDVRVVASTMSGLREAVNAGRFRENLYYCLNVVKISIPPLRDRKEDIGMLCDHFLRHKAGENGGAAKALHHATLSKLMEYDWPGNVRELRSVVEMAESMADGRAIMVKDIPEHVRESGMTRGFSFREAKKIWLEQFERHYLENLLLTNRGNISRASEEAGIARMSLYRMLKRNNLTQLVMNERSASRKNSSGAKSSGKGSGK